MATKRRGAQIGLDSQCLSYLLDALNGIQEPTDPLAEERKALVRIYFYAGIAFHASETVATEVARIRNIDRLKLHQRSMLFLIQDVPIRDRAAVDARVNELAAIHPKLNDCRILAEAEDLQLDVLLTYDHDFMKRLNSASPTAKLMAPSAYWTGLNIPRGARPKTGPEHTNPLRSQSWWRW